MSQQEIEKTLELPIIRSLDFSMFSDEDLKNVVLQRSEVMYDIPRSGKVIKAWENGDDSPLDNYIESHRSLILQRAAAVIYLEYQSLRPIIDKIKPKRIADIGCGYGLFDLFLAKDYGCHLTLIDIETNGSRHFGFEAQGAAYTSLDVARTCLKANGIAANNLATVNPKKEDVTKLKSMDMVFSFLSCGFHYPVTTYETFFKNNVTKNGAIILDLRARTAKKQSQLLSKVGDVQVIAERPKTVTIKVQC